MEYKGIEFKPILRGADNANFTRLASGLDCRPGGA